MEPNTNVNGGYSAGYGDEEWALGTLAMLTDDDQVLAMARKHVSTLARFRILVLRSLASSSRSKSSPRSKSSSDMVAFWSWQW